MNSPGAYPIAQIARKDLVPTSSHPFSTSQLRYLHPKTPQNTVKTDYRDVVPPRPDLVPPSGTTSNATSSRPPLSYGGDDVAESSTPHTPSSTSSLPTGTRSTR